MSSRFRNGDPAPGFRFARRYPVVNDGGSKLDSEIIGGSNLLFIFKSNPEIDLVVLNLRDLIGKLPSDVFFGNGRCISVVNQNNFLTNFFGMIDLFDVSSIKIEMSFNFRIAMSLQPEYGISRFSSSGVSGHLVSSSNNFSVNSLKFFGNSCFDIRTICGYSGNFFVMSSLQGSFVIFDSLDLSLKVSDLLSISIK